MRKITPPTQSNEKSSSATAQRARILALLAAHPCTTEELRQAGVYQAPARIKELRAMGHQITTARVSILDRDGFERRGVALYSLQGNGHD